MAVTALEIKSRSLMAGGLAFGEVGPYEQLDGTVHFGVDPDHPRNGDITDLKLAPRDSHGLVRCSSDFYIIRPADPQLGNHRVLLDVPNRGNRRALQYFNYSVVYSDPSTPMDPGDGFLMRHGYTVVWCGWQHDVPPVSGLMRIEVPDAVSRDGPLSGKVLVTFVPSEPIQVQWLSDRMHRPYPTNNLDDQEATLIVRDNQDAPPQRVPRDQWSFARLEDGHAIPDASQIYMSSGFVPGKVYQVVYSTTGAPVVGLGLVATRDMGSFLKYGTSGEGNPCADDIQRAFGFGTSQSGRFLRHFLYLGLNEDEEERTVFDGLIPHVAGGRRGEFNQRFGQPSYVAQQGIGNLFPFTDMEQADPDTGRRDGLLWKLATMGKMPKVFFTNSSAEYWRGDGSLIHTNPEGTRDVAPSESVRIYHYAGTQHPSGYFPLTYTNPLDGSRGDQPFGCVDYKPLLRAALVRLDRWVTHNEPPPPSRHPRIDDGTGVPPERIAGTFMAFPGAKFPGHLPHLSRLDFGPEAQEGISTKLPPGVGKAYPSLVSAVDEDGNELGGIRLPDIAVPLATHTGWNLRHTDMGAPDQLVGQFIGLLGSTIRFPATKVEREAASDPRASIEERYKSREDYLGRVRSVGRELVDERYLLPEDLEMVIEQSSQRYDRFRHPVKEPQAVDD